MYFLLYSNKIGLFHETPFLKIKEKLTQNKQKQRKSKVKIVLK